MRHCTKCGVIKGEDGYHKNGASRHTVCKICANLARKKYREENKELMLLRERASYHRNIETKKESIRKYYKANKSTIQQRMSDRYFADQERFKEQAKEYRGNNKDKVRAWNGTRRATVKNATPQWADRKKINKIYKEASLLWEATGVEHHVDHIIPLVHPNVCGLHVHDNLQVLTSSENLKKGNKFSV